MSQIHSSLLFTALSSGFEAPDSAPLSLQLQPGQHLVLSGPSGCGKSSLLKVIAGLMPAATGRFFWQGRQVELASMRWWREQICYLPQQAIMGADTLAEVLLLPWQLGAIAPPKPEAELMLDRLKRLGLRHSLDTQVMTLSGGEKQRLAIARALLMCRPVWLMDEPTSALDSHSRDQLMALLAELGITRVSVSHDSQWLKSADTVFTLKGHSEVNHG